MKYLENQQVKLLLSESPLVIDHSLIVKRSNIDHRKLGCFTLRELVQGEYLGPLTGKLVD
jgi:hypothetical protein